MRQKSRSRPHRTEARPAEAVPPEVAELLTQRSVEAAERLQEIAEGSDRTVAKAARRALYTLKLAGIEPPEREVTATLSVIPAPTVAHRALMSNVGGTGSRMLLFLRDDPYGGSPLLLSFLVNDEQGLVDLAGRKMPRRELDEFLEEWRAREGSLLIEVPVDYARHALQTAVRQNVRSREPIPEGYSEWFQYVGPPENDYPRPLIYDYLDAETVRKDLSISHDPDHLFEYPLFQGWFLDIEEIGPWADRFAESQQSRLILDRIHLARRGDQVLEEAADALLGGSGVASYRRRLEENALVLHLAGKTEAAREALYHALTLEGDRPPHTYPFALALVRRSVNVLLAMEAKEEEKRERESPGLIERIW